MINILIRTSNRPIYFDACVRSIEKQTYKDVNIVVGSDANDTYCNRFNPVKYAMTRSNGHYLQFANGIKAMHFPYNLYFNEMYKRCADGWVIFLDDDDEFARTDSLELIMDHLDEQSKAAFWRVDICGRIIPSDENFGNRPVVKDVSMIGFAFHSKYIPVLQLDSYKQADYRLADRIYSLLDCQFIDDVLTKTQRRTGEGYGLRRDKVK